MTSRAQRTPAVERVPGVDTVPHAAAAPHTDYIVAVRGWQAGGVVAGVLVIALLMGFAAGWWMRGRRAA